MIQLTASKNVYKRTTTDVDKAALGYVRIGEVMSIAAVEVGLLLDGNGLWYRTEGGSYHWSGAFDKTDFVLAGADYTKLSDNDKHTVVSTAIARLGTGWRSKIEDCRGFATGTTDAAAGGVALVIYTTSGSIPADIAPGNKIEFCGFSIPVVAKMMGAMKAHVYVPRNKPYIEKDAPFLPGGSISAAGSTGYGSRSLIVTKGDSSTPYILTCYHVLGEALLKKGTTKYIAGQTAQPRAHIPSGTPEFAGGATPRGMKMTEGFVDGVVDYALAEFPALLGTLNHMPGGNPIISYYSFKERTQLKDKRVKMFGATSLNQEGVVKEIDASVDVAIPGFSNYKYYGLIVTSKISTGGDSGAPVVDMNDKLVGIIVGGDDTTTSLIVPFFRIALQSIKIK